MVALRIGLDHLHRLQFLQPRLLRDLVFSFVGIVLQMAYVGDIPHIADLISKMLEEAEENVVRNSRTGVAQMGVAVNGRTAHIHAHMARMNGDEELLAACKGIGQIEISHKKSSLKNSDC
jgi:hypothetical protein